MRLQAPDTPGISRCPPQMEQRSVADDAVRLTDNDAATSRLSAVNAGYLKDEFAALFVRRASKRPPIINRGSFCRTTAIDTLVQRFLEDGVGPKQIVSLGAGSDTRFLCLKTANRAPKKYFEIDFLEVTAKKAHLLKRHWWDTVFPHDETALVAAGGCEVHAKDYSLISGDLRKWEDIANRLEQHGFDKTLPTLFLSECVLIYLDSADSDKIVSWISNQCPLSCFAIYEQILPNDPFGTVMLQNLMSRCIELRGIHAYPTLEAQRKRFLDRGFARAGAVDIQTVHDRIIDPEEIKRINKIEMLDEVEEWNLLGQHYCIAWAVRSDSSVGSAHTPEEEVKEVTKCVETQKGECSLFRLDVRPC